MRIADATAPFVLGSHIQPQERQVDIGLTGFPEQDTVLQRVMDLAPAIRYVAIYEGGELHTRQRQDLRSASESESDRYEELLVNPALLVLTHQRGKIDCGGLEFIVVAYGNFYQLVMPTSSGHVSVAIERDHNPLEYVPALRKIFRLPSGGNE